LAAAVTYAKGASISSCGAAAAAFGALMYRAPAE